MPVRPAHSVLAFACNPISDSADGRSVSSLQRSGGAVTGIARRASRCRGSFYVRGGMAAEYGPSTRVSLDIAGHCAVWFRKQLRDCIRPRRHSSDCMLS